jgi:hypothetical protein
MYGTKEQVIYFKKKEFHWAGFMKTCENEYIEVAEYQLQKTIKKVVLDKLNIELERLSKEVVGLSTKVAATRYT